MKSILALPLFLLIGCSSVDSKISKLALPVDKAVLIGNVIATAWPLADLDQDGKVPTSLAELAELVKQVKRLLYLP